MSTQDTKVLLINDIAGYGKVALSACFVKSKLPAVTCVASSAETACITVICPIAPALIRAVAPNDLSAVFAFDVFVTIEYSTMTYPHTSLSS